MRYYGDFRSLDTSVDPNGQKYRVLIFTGYDGNSSGRIYTGPYPWSYNITFESTGGGDIRRVYHYYPTNGTELTMAANPFVVRYEGEQDKLCKPYRCSSATVSFLQSSLNTEFINSFGQSVLVMLLKWNNDVYQSASNKMKNAATGAEITKKTYRYFDQITESYRTQRYDFDPWEYDKFCYNVEWIGFSTPTMLNVEYDHVFDTFTLECQDALSTLKYTKFTRTAQLEDMMLTLFRMLRTLGTYKDIYLTTSIHMPAAWNDLEAQHPPTGNALRWISHQQDNFIDEDGEPLNYMDILEDMMEYLGLTAIPYQDKLYIVNSIALGNGHTDYNHYQFQSENDILPWILPCNIANVTPTRMSDVNIVDTVHLNKDSFCGGTQISSNYMYNKIKIVCDEMRPSPLLPDITDEANIAPELPIQSQPMEQNHWKRVYNSSTHEYEPQDYQYLEGYLMRPADDFDEIKLYKYTYSALNTCSWNMPCTEVTDEDLKITHHRKYLGATGENFPYVEWVQGVIPPPADDNSQPGIFNSIGLIMDYGNVSVSSKTAKPNYIGFERTYILIGNPNSCFRKETAAQDWRDHDWDDKSTYWQPLLYVKSKPFLSNGKQYLNLQGTFRFFATKTWTDRSPTKTGQAPMGWLPVRPQINMTSSDAYMFTYASTRCFLWMKIKCGEYYLTSNDQGQYSWDVVDAPLKVYLNNDDNLTSASSIMLNHNFSIKDTTRGIQGLCIKLPTFDGYAEPSNVEIWIDRPLGPCSGAPQSATLKDFAVNIYSSEYVESRKRRNPDRDNTEYHNEVVAGAVEEYPTVSLIHSSCDTAGLSYAETARHTIRRRSVTDVWKTNPKIMNDGDGYFGLPEEVGIRSMKHYLETPTITLQTDLFNNITPISRIVWSHMPNNKFIVGSMSIDYEYEQCNLSLIQVKEPSTTVEYGGVYRVNITRNYHRTRDLMFDGHVARRIEVELGGAPGTLTNEIEVEEYEVNLTTDSEALGCSNLNVDWDRGLFRLTTSSEGGMTGSSSNGLVTLTV